MNTSFCQDDYLPSRYLPSDNYTSELIAASWVCPESESAYLDLPLYQFGGNIRHRSGRSPVTAAAAGALATMYDFGLPSPGLFPSF